MIWCASWLISPISLNSSMSMYLAWIKYFSWLMYANEAMTIVQWEGVDNICKNAFLSTILLHLHDVLINNNHNALSFVYNAACLGNNTQLPCLRTADDIFDQYSFSAENFYMDLWALGALYISFNCLALLILWQRTKRLCWGQLKIISVDKKFFFVFAIKFDKFFDK